MLLGTIAGLLLAEAALRLAGYSPSYVNAMGSFHEADPITGHRGKRDFTARFKNPQFDVEIVHNAAGFRRQEAQNPVTATTHRAFVFGDSFVWGWGVDQGEVFTDQLSRRMSDWCIENLGINGTGTVAQYELFAGEFRERLQPGDTVLLMFFANDFTDNVEGTRHASIVDGEVVTQPASSQLRSGWQRYLQESSHLANFISYVVNRWQHDRHVRRAHDRAVELAAAVERQTADTPVAKTPPAPAAPVAVVEPAPQQPEVHPPVSWQGNPQLTVTRHYLDIWQRDCQSRHAQFLVAYIPGVAELGEGGNAATAAAERAARQAFFGLTGELSIATIDLLPDMLAARRHENLPSLIIAGDGHWNSAGHRVVADILAARLSHP